MRTSVAMMYNTQTTTLGMLAMTLGGNAGSMFDNLRNLANSSTITDKNKKALLNMLSSGTNQFNGIMSLIKSGDDALIKIVSDKLDELEIPLELNYLAIDDIYTTQMQQAMNSQSSSYYILVNCATSFDMPIMDVWNRKTQEIQGIFQYQNDPSTIYSSLQSNPIVVAVQNLTDTYSLRLANCGSIPSDACVNDLVCISF